jgi:hypothetical protein
VSVGRVPAGANDLNAASKMTVSDTHPVTITLTATAVWLRYAPDSVKYSYAKSSTLVMTIILLASVGLILAAQTNGSS